jgi:hypothetical protein
MLQKHEDTTICPPSSVICPQYMMYVEGNPVMFGDESGNNRSENELKKFIKAMTKGARKIGKAMDGGARWLASGGTYSRNKRHNDLFGSNEGFIGKHVNWFDDRIGKVSTIRTEDTGISTPNCPGNRGVSYYREEL